MKILLFLFLSIQCHAQQLTIATASNFKATLNEILERYQMECETKIITVNGSTGSLFSQIQNGAPYDIFFAANQKHPDLLVKSGLVKAKYVRNYVHGTLVFMVNSQFDDNNFLSWLKEHPRTRLVLANPKTAPYGHAAKQVLENLNQYHMRRGNLVYSGNALKVLHVLETDNAGAGFGALSTALTTKKRQFWVVPEHLYSPIIQAMVLLDKSSENPEAIKFFNFMKTPEIHKLLLNSGYRLPGA